MEFLASELSQPFDHTDAEGAASVLSEHYRVTAARLTRLDTERDDTFRVEAAGGQFVLKIAHPADDPAVIDLQSTALLHASRADPSLPFQRLVPTLAGEVAPRIDERITRLFTWLPGTLLRHAGPISPERLTELGASYGRTTAALADFRHDAAHRMLSWDIARLGELRPLSAGLPELAPVLDRFSALRDRLAALPHQIVHNDLNTDNVLVSTEPGAPFVAGILDFGDIVYTARVCDLAVALSYLLPSSPEGEAAAPGSWESVLPVVRGYLAETALREDELDLLYALVEARLAQRILIARWLREAVPENAIYTGRNVELSEGQLRGLQATDATTAREQLRQLASP